MSDLLMADFFYFAGVTLVLNLVWEKIPEPSFALSEIKIGQSYRIRNQT
jgi:hypothetical protein